ncbi:class I SAM-dependent methyltransferase [Nocardioides marinquilinus]|uniref:Class I SAM-dependent methyltransferase n=1 Tax=Nocardioides marinquilinus TaxID=1210400 RepID=A0ABP9Q1M8_9ACTN
MANEAMREQWTAGAAGWVENESLFDTVFAPVTAAILDAAGFEAGQRVLDVGCGSGTLLAAAAAADAEPVGVDVSPGMVEGARRRVPGAVVVVADAQTAPLLEEAPGRPFERVVSRFGVMFFDDPTAAFANLRAACAPGARLAFACWRGEEENPMFTLGTEALLAQMAEPSAAAAPGAPGPTAFADPDRLSALLAEAGWGEVATAPLDAVADYGAVPGFGADGVEARLTASLATSTGRRARAELEPRLGEAGWAALLDDVRTDLRRHLDDGVIRFPLACWLVTAVA